MSFENHGNVQNQAYQQTIQGPVYHGVVNQHSVHHHSLAPTNDSIERACLKALKCPSVVEVKDRLRQSKNDVVRNSIDWILNDTDYRSWLKGIDCRLLWIKGGAGKGKTMISIGVLDHLLTLRDLSSKVTYFFCQHSDHELNTIAAILKNLIVQLFTTSPEAREPLRNTWHPEDNCFGEDITSWKVLWIIWQEMVELSPCKTIYVVVDALDECRGQGMGDFLRSIVRAGLGPHSRVRWLLTSRAMNEADHELLGGAERVQIDLEQRQREIADAVERYICTRTTELDNKHRYGPELRQQIEAELKDKAESTFLWVNLVCQRLDGVSRHEALATIRELPPGLYPFYHRIFAQLEDADSTIVKGCTQLLQAMGVVYRPLNVQEIASVIGTVEDASYVAEVLARCASFVQTYHGQVRFIHQSIQDFFAEHDGRSLLSAYGYRGHRDIALSCLSHLSTHLKVNLVNLPRPDSAQDEIAMSDGTKDGGLLASLSYAATFWIQHATAVAPQAVTEDLSSETGPIGMFLQTRLLEWLECLSLLGQLFLCIPSLEILSRLMESYGNRRIPTLLEDIERVLRSHYQTIATWPLQIYSSVLIFSPEASLVRQMYSQRIPVWLLKAPRMAEWSCLVQTITAFARNKSSLYDLTISPDGKQIAASTYPGTIKVWDTDTGENRLTLKMPDSTGFGLAFSSDGRQLALGAYGGVVKCCDIVTGELQYSVAVGRDFSIVTIAFLPHNVLMVSSFYEIGLWSLETKKLIRMVRQDHDHVSILRPKVVSSGEYIATCARDTIEMIRVQDGETKRFPRRLSAEGARYRGLALSADGKFVALLNEYSIDIRDFDTFRFRRRLEDHCYVGGMAFSPDGKLLLSCSTTLKIWDVTTGELLNTLNGHTDYVRHVSFLPNGRQAVSGSDDGSIKIWNITTIQHSVPDHTGEVMSVTISPNGQYVASTSNDKTVKLWCSSTYELQATLSGHDSYVSCAAFTPNSEHIVSGSWDYTVKVWQVRSGRLVRTLQGHRRCVEEVACSPVEDIVASGDREGIIKLWDIKTGRLYWTVRAHGWTRSLDFSPDGKQVASCSTSDIELWKVKTGWSSKRLIGHTHNVETATFSPDGRHIASASFDKTVRLWDVAKSLNMPVPFVGEVVSRVVKFGVYHESRLQEAHRSRLKFSPDGRRVVADQGSIELQGVLAAAPFSSPGAVSAFSVWDQWIALGTRRFLRVPTHLEVVYCDILDDRIHIGCKDGTMLSLWIDRKGLSTALEASFQG